MLFSVFIVIYVEVIVPTQNILINVGVKPKEEEEEVEVGITSLYNYELCYNYKKHS